MPPRLRHAVSRQSEDPLLIPEKASTSNAKGKTKCPYCYEFFRRLGHHKRHCKRMKGVDEQELFTGPIKRRHLVESDSDEDFGSEEIPDLFRTGAQDGQDDAPIDGSQVFSTIILFAGTFHLPLYR